MSCVDKSLAAQEKHGKERSAKEAYWRKHAKIEATMSSAMAVLESSSTSSCNNSTSEEFVPKEAQGAYGGASSLK